MTAGVFGPNNYFFWNIESNVGPGCKNNIEDVHLVQLAYASMAQNPMIDAAERMVYKNVIPGAPYTGLPGDPLSVAIKTHQKSRGGTQDGHVSPIGKSGSYGSGTFMLIPLNNNIRSKVTNLNWPRIDQHPLCTPVLRAAVARSLHIQA